MPNPNFPRNLTVSFDAVAIHIFTNKIFYERNLT